MTLVNHFLRSAWNNTVSNVNTVFNLCNQCYITILQAESWFSRHSHNRLSKFSSKLSSDNHLLVTVDRSLAFLNNARFFLVLIRGSCPPNLYLGEWTDFLFLVVSFHWQPWCHSMGKKFKATLWEGSHNHLSIFCNSPSPLFPPFISDLKQIKKENIHNIKIHKITEQFQNH